jgi:SAM-dependent methyltransferase
MAADPTHNPQAEQMADESMLRCLQAQADAIWPQERPLIEAYGLAPGAAIVDVGCGSGVVSERLLDLLPASKLTGIDIHAPHLVLARERCARFGDRATFAEGDAYALELSDASADLAVCRHLTQAIPEPDRVVAELARVTRPGGVVHVLAEDYAMMHFSPTERDCDEFWRIGPKAYAAGGDTDLMGGRAMGAVLRGAGLQDVTVRYVVVDTLRVERETFAAIWSAWRDGYSDAVAQASGLTLSEVRAYWEEMLAAIRNPDGYGVWFVPVWSGRTA